MRPGILFAAGCFAVLGYWYVVQAQSVSALMMFALAAGLVVVGVMPSGRHLGTAPRRKARPTAPAASVSTGPVRDRARSVLIWQIIAVGGLALSVAGAFLFPPMSLVVAALALYAVYRVRQERAEALA